MAEDAGEGYRPGRPAKVLPFLFDNHFIQHYAYRLKIKHLRRYK